MKNILRKLGLFQEKTLKKKNIKKQIIGDRLLLEIAVRNFELKKRGVK